MRQGRTGPLHLTVGSAPLDAPSATVGPIDATLSPFTGRAAPGIIGSQLFREHVVEIDAAAGLLRLHPPATFAYHGTGTTIPLRFVGGLPVADGSLTVPGRDPIPARLLVDLGAKATLLVTEPYIARNGLMSAFPHRVIATLGAGVGGETRYAFVRLPTLSLGATSTIVAHDVVAGLSVEGTLRSDSYDALLGAEFLRRYRVFFDYSRNRMILEPRADPGPPAELDMSGTYLTAGGPDHRRFTIHRIVPDGPAAEAGLHTGDELVTVNDRAASAWSLGTLRDLLRSGEGREVRFVVLRAGRRASYTLRLRRLV